jgi:glyoxylase-like metal-dependent hydrolase (beta-lactamase superfamily II)
MNPEEARLHYPFGDAVPAPGQALAIADGVRWLRMPLPFALDHVNLWLLEDRDDDGRAAWAAVDTGISAEATQAAWQQLFDGAMAGAPLARVVATHMHPDHIGLAWWLVERFAPAGCRFHASAADYALARLGSTTTQGFGGEAAAQHFAAHGLTDDEALAKIRARAAYYPSLVPKLPPCYQRLRDGERLRIGAHDWLAIAGYGHAPEHISLYCAELGLLIAGDMVLPRISTNVSVIDMEPEADPIALYLESLERLRRLLPADTRVLPSHGKPFDGLHERIAQLHAHHAARLAETEAACREAPRSAADIVPLMFRRALDLHQLTFAMGEALAHLNHLWLAGRLLRTRGADGVLRFAAAPSTASI